MPKNIEVANAFNSFFSSLYCDSLINIAPCLTYIFKRCVDEGVCPDPKKYCKLIIKN